jgi:preprotein translocase subunit SecF
MFNIIRYRKLYYAISLLMVVPGIISLLIPPSLRLAVDFTGGTLWELQYAQQVPAPAEVKERLAQLGYGDAIVQTSGENAILIRSKEIPSEQKEQVAQPLRDSFGQFTELRFESVGPAVGQEIAGRAVLGVALASLGILLYIVWAFRKIENSFRYGVCAITSVITTGLLVLGVFSVLGKLFFVEVDALFVTAMMTVIGFAVHDTIVTFDRIRENARRMHGQPFEVVVNHSLLQTIVRSLVNSLTIVFTLSALVMFGGSTTRPFALTLLLGVVAGTYSSIFTASALLVSWETGELGRFFRRGSVNRPASARP